MRMASNCALTSHKRIHQGRPRHVCPECGVTFETWHLFKHHVQKTCFHENRVLTFECVLCKRKGHHQPYVEDASLFAHFYESHIQLLYKCTSCNRAFAEKTAIYAHRNEMHHQTEDVDDDEEQVFSGKGVKRKEMANRKKNHHKKSSLSTMAKSSSAKKLGPEFSILYKAAFLKRPHKLFSTREAFEVRMMALIKKWRRDFRFKCFSCEALFEGEL